MRTNVCNRLDIMNCNLIYDKDKRTSINIIIDGETLSNLLYLLSEKTLIGEKRRELEE